MNSTTIGTIGHSNHPIEKFVELLRTHHTSAVADVRSQPYSRMYPQFNREALEGSLLKYGIAYVFLGRELGARSQDPSCYENGKVQYRRLAKTGEFQAAIRRLQLEVEKHNVVLMCAESEPLQCHRTILVAREITDAGTNVMHIHPDGHLESHADAMRRLLKLLGWPDQEDLFRSYSQLLEEAYAEQENRIAYVDPGLVTEDSSTAP